ncbi:MAG: hypothetical protein DVB31_15805 [Verrucomicrobia bacterium]|nr:MAG: hypothetical protein DVB31_15805 [Verrucomicrobiota bacterium]
MDPADALAQLETIRIIMERAALYRRALGPICLCVGGVGVLAGGVGFGLHVENVTAFAALWLGAALAAVALAFFVARRQALGAGEPFWSPPTRRIASALLPPLVAGAALAVPFLLGEDWARRVVWLLPALWMILYGCALQAAGFFMRRGIRLLGWAYAVAGIADLLWWTCPLNQFPSIAQSHLVMGLGFGVGHLVYGAYLQITEHRAET